MRALVVDDTSSVRAILHRTTQERGFEVETVSNGCDALAVMARSHPDLVLIDWNLPAMSGFELLQAIRRKPDYDRVKVVMVTSQASEADIPHALAAGANEYIMKPPFTSEGVYDKSRLVGLAMPYCEEIHGRYKRFRK